MNQIARLALLLSLAACLFCPAKLRAEDAAANPEDAVHAAAEQADASAEVQAEQGKEPQLKDQQVKAEPEDSGLHFEPAPALPKFEGLAGERVVWIPIHDTIDLGLSAFVARALSEASTAQAILFDIDSLGGRIDAAIKIRDAILACKTPTFAYVNRRAISAGALIALASDHIIFAPGGSMGAATPIQVKDGQAEAVGEKMVSYMRAEMRATAEAKHRSGAMAEAMVDADLAFGEWAPKGKLLTLSADEAQKVGLTGAAIETQAALLQALGLEHAQQETMQVSWAENISRFLTDPTVSGILMSLGMLGLVVELWTPGFGLPGIAGLLCLACFFGGHMIASLAGFLEIGLFLLGVILLALEILVIPGFGIAGVLGIASLVVSLVLTMVGLPIDVAWETGALASAFSTVLISLVVVVIGMIFLIKKLPKFRLAKGLVLETQLETHGAEEKDQSNSFVAAPEEWSKWLGQTGVAVCDLRMAGKARLGDSVVDVVSQDEYIQAGEAVRVVLVEGMRVVVVKA